MMGDIDELSKERGGTYVDSLTDEAKSRQVSTGEAWVDSGLPLNTLALP